MNNNLKNQIKSVPTEPVFVENNKPRRILFDHLPKCAGTTISDYLLRHYSPEVVFKTYTQQFELVKKFQSLPENSRYFYRLIVGHGTDKLIDYVHPDTITLTIFRDPIDRIVSHYFFVKQQKKHYLHERVIKSNLSLEDYASSGLSPELRNYYTTHFSGLSIEEAEMNPEKSLSIAVEKIETYDVVGFQENLTAVVNKLKNVANLIEPFENKVINKTGKRIGIKQVSDRAKKTIAEVNSLDVKLYDLLKARIN